MMSYRKKSMSMNYQSFMVVYVHVRLVASIVRRVHGLKLKTLSTIGILNRIQMTTLMKIMAVEVE